MSKYKVTWRPLTSEPEILNELMYNLGMERKTAFQDLVDIDTDLDDAIALIAIFAESEEDEKRKEAEEKRRKIPDPGLLGIKYFFKQNIDNACGMFAIVNAILNSPAASSVKSGSILDNIAQACSIEVTNEMKSIYDKAVMNDDLDSPVEYHFSALVEVPVPESERRMGTYLVELDGERHGPYIRASSSGSSLRDPALIRHVYGTNLAGMFKLVQVD